MSTLTERDLATQRVTLPRVNLLPPEIEQRRRLKQVQGGLGLGVVAAVAVVGALVLGANGSVSEAEDDYATEQARGSALETQMATYADVPAVYAGVEAAEAELGQAMSKEIRWSYLLNDLSLATPDKVWLTQMTVTESVDAAAPAVVAGLGEATYGTTNIGTITFRGKGYTHNDVAAWLRALAGTKGLADPYFTQSAEEKIGTQDAVTFDSQAVITEDLLSGRFSDKAGS